MFGRALPILSVSIFFIAAGTFFSLPSAGRYIGSFERTWKGKLESVDSGSSKDSDSDKRTKLRMGKPYLKMAIHGQSVRVYFGETEVKPDLFHAQIYMTNAVVFASSTGNDLDCEWVETWDFALTQKIRKV